MFLLFCQRLKIQNRCFCKQIFLFRSFYMPNSFYGRDRFFYPAFKKNPPKSIDVVPACKKTGPDCKNNGPMRRQNLLVNPQIKENWPMREEDIIVSLLHCFVNPFPEHFLQRRKRRRPFDHQLWGGWKERRRSNLFKLFTLSLSNKDKNTHRRRNVNLIINVIAQFYLW